MAALGWLLNLGFAGGGEAVVVSTPAKTISGVRRPAYPRRLQIFGKRYWVRSLLEERDLLKRLYAEQEAKLETKSQARKTEIRYRLKRVKTRLEKIDKGEAYEALRKQWDEEILFFM